MKKRLFIVVLALVVLFAALTLTASAATEVASGTCGDNLTWTLDSDGVLTISGEGEMAYYLDEYAPWYNYRDQIRSVVITPGVTSIGDCAFHNCINLTSVVIPEGVTSIGGWAFENCTSLITVNIPSSVDMVGEWVFAGCINLTTVTFEGYLPEYLDEGTFIDVTATVYYPCNDDYWTDYDPEYYEGELTWVARHNYVNDVCEYCGDGGYVASGTCGENLTWTLDEDGVLTISGTGAMSIYDMDFDVSYCPWESSRKQITSVVIEPGVTNIGYEAFMGCSNLISVDIPDSVTSIEGFAFRGCSSLTSIVIPEGVTSISVYAFHNCTSLTSVVIPDSVTSIYWAAFSSCESLTSIVIPEGVITIGEGAFSGCDNLTSITFEGSAPTIYYDAFEDVTATVYYPCNDDSWTQYKIKNYEGTLSWVKNHNYVDDVCEYCGDGDYVASGTCGENLAWTLDEDGVLTISGTGAMEDYGENAETPWHAYRTSIKKVVLEPGVTSIGSCAFGCAGGERCDMIEEIVLPEGVTKIELFGIHGLNKLKRLDIPSTLTSIEDEDLEGLTSVTEFTVAPGNQYFASEDGVLYNADQTLLRRYPAKKTGDTLIIPDSVTRIGNFALAYCSNLTSIVIPDSVTSIGYDALDGCTNLSHITFNGSAPEFDGQWVFNRIPATVHYPCNDSSWTEDVMSDFGNELTWVKNHHYMDGVCEYCGLITGTCGDNLTWTLDEDGVLTIFGKGSMGNFGEGTAPWYKHRLKIKEVVLKPGITDIGSHAFYYCTKLTSVTIPEGVTSIGYDAFYYCTKLTSVTVPEGVTSIGEYAFAGCSGLTSVSIGNGVISIGYDAFSDCSGLTSIVIPDSVTSIGSSTFSGCSSLTSIDIPEGVTSIGSYAFYNCSNLTSVVIPEGVTSIGSSTFSGCSSLTSIDIPEGVTSIGDNAFFACSSLTSIVIPEGVTSIGSYAFYGCSSLTSIVIPEGVASIGVSVFSRCSSLTEIIIPEGVVSIGRDAFSYCESLTSVVLPEGVTSIGNDAFRNCKALASVNIPSGVKKIEYSTFEGCKSLTAIVIPESVTSIGSVAFYGCEKLISVTFEGSAPSFSTLVFCGVKATAYYPCGDESWGEDALQNHEGTLTWLKVHSFVDGACEHCGIIGGPCGENVCWTLVDGVLTVYGEGAMDDHDFFEAPWYAERMQIEQVIIVNGVTTIGDNSFESCKNMTSVAIPKSVTSIGSNAFYSCASLVSIVIPENVTEIREYTFSGCENLISIDISKGVTRVGQYAFAECGLKLVTFVGESPEIADDAFSNTCDVTVYHPCTWSKGILLNYGGDLHWVATHSFADSTCEHCGITGDRCGDVYWTLKDGVLTVYGEGAMRGYSLMDSNRAPWYNSRSEVKQIVVGYGVTSIGKYAFYGCSSLTEIVIPDSVTSIGYSAFRDCKALTSVNIPSGMEKIEGDTFFGCESLISIDIPEGVTSIGSATFYGCSSLTTIEIPEGVTSIGSSAFSYCESLTSVVIPEGVTSIGSATFYGCSSLTSIVIPEGVTSIGDDAFENCTSLTSIELPEGLITLGNYAFGRCTSLTSIVIPEGVTSIGNHAFQNCSSLTSIVIPEGVTSIEWSTFDNCSSLTSIVIPEGVTSIGYDAFYNCSSLTSITFEGSAPSIDSNAFARAIATVTYPCDGTWTEDVCKDYGGLLHWIKIHSFVDHDCIGCEAVSAHIISQIEDVTVYEGEPVELIVEAGGDGLTYEWYYKHPGGKSFLYTDSFKGNVYSISSMTKARSGRQVYCVITDQYGNEVKTDTVTLTCATPLKITTQSTDGYAIMGNTCTVKFEVQGDGLTYKWYYKNANADKFSYTSSFKGNTYSVAMTEARAGRQVYCVITDQYGNSVQTDTVTLVCMTELKILSQPIGVRTPVGEAFNVSVNAQGDGLTYQWLYRDNGGEWVKSANIGSTYADVMTESPVTREVYCEITDAYGNSVTSETVEVVSYTELKILTQPVDTLTAFGERCEVVVEAQGDRLTYKWYYKNTTSSKFVLTTACTGNTYFIDSMSASRSGRQVYCVITDRYGSKVQTDTVTITGYNALKIVTQPTDGIAPIGQRYCVSVEAQGDGLTYKWYFRNPGTEKWKASSVTDNTYDDTMTETRAGREVYCLITDQYGHQVKTDVVKLVRATELKVTSQPTDVQSTIGEKFSFAVKAQGDGLTYQWFSRSNGGEWQKTSATGSTYSGVASVNSEFYCVITDAYGDSVESDVVVLTCQTELKILTQPVDTFTAVGKRCEVTVEAQGDGLTYKWYYKNTTSTKFVLTTACTGNTYFIDSMTMGRSGRQVYCVITDQYGNKVQTDTVTLTAYNELKITSQPTDGIAPIGQNFTVKVEAEGDGLTYKWYFRNSGSPTWQKSSVSGNVYSGEMTKTKIGREIRCVITDQYGNKVEADIVKLICPTELKIISQPTDVYASLGEKFYVTVKAQGDGLTYKWYFRNAGSSEWGVSSIKTNIYDATMTEERNGREVYCEITDAYGNKVQSDVVKLIGLVASGTCGDNLSWMLDLEGVLTISGNGAMQTCETNSYDGDGYPWYPYRQMVKRVILADGVTSIGDWAFYGCNVMEEIILPEGLTRVGELAFCFSPIKRLDIPSTLIFIGGEDLDNLSSVTEFTVAPGNLRYSSVNGILYSADQTELLRYPAGKSEETVTVSASVTLISEYAFNECRNLKNIVFECSFGTQNRWYEWSFANVSAVCYYPCGDRSWTEHVMQSCGGNLTWVKNHNEVTDEATDPTCTSDGLTEGKHCSICSKVLVAQEVISAIGHNFVDNDCTGCDAVSVHIVKQPTDAYAMMGENCSVKVTAKGDGLTYKWYYKNSGSKNFAYTSSFKSNNYSVSMTEARAGRQVYCVVTDQYGNSVTTDTVTLICGTKVKLLAQPTDTYTAMGDKYSIKIEVEGDGLTYTWYYRNAGVTAWTKSGLTGNTFGDTMTASRAGRQIYCVITDQYGNSVTTNIVTLIAK